MVVFPCTSSHSAAFREGEAGRGRSADRSSGNSAAPSLNTAAESALCPVDLSEGRSASTTAPRYWLQRRVITQTGQSSTLFVPRPPEKRSVRVRGRSMSRAEWRC
ncbi:hypothetical protein MHYP_G00205470 [Metynnis hypsauchen]